MTGRVIPRSSHSGQTFKDALRYIGEDRKREFWFASRQILDLETAATEMDAAASRSHRIKDPIYHLVLSWPDHERPNERQAQQVVERVFEELGAGAGIQWVASLHKDVMHSHLHVIASLVDGETYKRAFSGWDDWAAIDRALREVAREHGWDIPAEFGTYGEAFQRRASRGAEAFHIWGGHLSFQQWASFAPAAEIQRDLEKGTATWEDVHRILGRYNIGYRPKTGPDGEYLRDESGRLVGAVVFDLDAPEKRLGAAGQIARFLRIGEMEGEHGLGQPFTTALEIYAPTTSYRQAVMENIERNPEMQSPVYRRYEQAMTEAGAAREERKNLWKEHRERQHEERREVKARIADDRERAKESAPNDFERRLMIAGLAVRETNLLTDLRKRHDQERSELRATLDPLPKAMGWRHWLTRQARGGDRECLEVLERVRERQLGEKRIIHAGYERTLEGREISERAIPSDRPLNLAREVAREARGHELPEEWRGIEGTYNDDLDEKRREEDRDVDDDRLAKAARDRKLRDDARTAADLAEEVLRENERSEQRAMEQRPGGRTRDGLYVLIAPRSPSGFIDLLDESEAHYFADLPDYATTDHVCEIYAARLGKLETWEAGDGDLTGTLIAYERVAEGGYLAFLVKGDGTIVAARVAERPTVKGIGREHEAPTLDLDRERERPPNERERGGGDRPASS